MLLNRVCTVTFIPALNYGCVIYSSSSSCAFSTVHLGAWRFNSAKLSLITFYAYADRPVLSTGRLIHWQCFIINATLVLEPYIRHFIFISLLLPHFFYLSWPPASTLCFYIVMEWDSQFGIMTFIFLVLNTKKKKKNEWMLVVSTLNNHYNYFLLKPTSTITIVSLIGCYQSILCLIFKHNIASKSSPGYQADAGLHPPLSSLFGVLVLLSATLRLFPPSVALCLSLCALSLTEISPAPPH